MNKFIRSLVKKRVQCVFYMDHPSAIVAATPRKPVTIVDITRDNVDHVIDFRGERIKNAFVNFLNEQQCGVYACLNSRVVGHAWAKICEEDCCKVNGYMEIQHAEALIHFCNVREDQRGQNIYPTMLTALCSRLFNQLNVQRIFIDTETDNMPSLRGIAKVGFKPLGKGTYLQIHGHLVYKKFVTKYDGLSNGN